MAANIEGKYGKRENARASKINEEGENTRTTGKSPANRMGGKKIKPDKKLVTFQAVADIYEKFDRINTMLGTTNTAVFNVFIAKYVEEHENNL